jgi:GLPGLI family protein
MKRLLLISLFSLSYLISLSQSFEGVIKFNISYESMPADMADAIAMLPQEQTFFIKNHKSKFVQVTSTANTMVISDSEAQTSIILMEAMGQKYKMSMTTDEVKSVELESTEGITIEYIDETKMIAGYECKKALVTMEGFDEKAIFYYTEKIAPLQLSGMEGLHLKGLPLEYIISMGGMKMVMKATTVEKTEIPDSTFDIPEGYTEMPDNMRSAMEQADN